MLIKRSSLSRITWRSELKNGKHEEETHACIQEQKSEFGGGGEFGGELFYTAQTAVTYVGIVF